MRAAVVAGLALAASYVHAQSNKDLYELQVRCGEQAARAFRQDYAPVTRTKEGTTQLSNYENHFSAQFNKCFFLEIVSFFGKGGSSTSLRLFDLNENKQYGSYFKGGSGIMDCQVRDKQCSSEEEWRKLAKPYLDD